MCDRTFTPLMRYQNPALSGNPDGWYDCAAEVAAMGADYQTCGAKRPSGQQIRNLTNEPTPNPSSPGLDVYQIQEALDDLGVHVIVFRRASWEQVLEWVDVEGRGVGLAVQYSVIRPTDYSGDPNFYSGHAMFVPPGWEVMDPLCDGRRAGIYRYQHEPYPKGLMRLAAGAFRVRYSSGLVAPIGEGYAQGWMTEPKPKPGAPQPEDSDVVVTDIVHQRWTANGPNGVLRATPRRNAPILARLPAGTVITSRAEAETADGNHWRMVNHPAGTRGVAWLLRYGPGVPKDHDFVAGLIVPTP